MNDAPTPREVTQDAESRPAAYVAGARDERPWGVWECLAVGMTYCAKRITVRPGQRLSLQRHEHRDEHWVVVVGRGVVTLGPRDYPAFPGALFAVPAGMVHRIAAHDDGLLVMIEVQCGLCLEEDIERLEDDHGRA